MDPSLPRLPRFIVCRRQQDYLRENAGLHLNASAVLCGKADNLWNCQLGTEVRLTTLTGLWTAEVIECVTHLFCNRYWAFWIWSWVPVMVMMRSSDPCRGSSILIDAPDSWRICLILWPPLPMMDPASWESQQRVVNTCFMCKAHRITSDLLTSLGIVTCVVITGSSL